MKATVKFDRKHGALPETIEFDDVYDWPELQQLHQGEGSMDYYIRQFKEVPVGAVEIAHLNKNTGRLEISYQAKKNVYTKTFESEQFEIEYSD